MTDFTFNEKTGEIARGGKLLALCRLHAQIFDAAKGATVEAPVPAATIAEQLRLGMNAAAVCYEMRAVNRRLSRLGLHFRGVHGRRKQGFALVVDPMPKWEPRIPPEQEIAR